MGLKWVLGALSVLDPAGEIGIYRVDNEVKEWRVKAYNQPIEVSD